MTLDVAVLAERFSAWFGIDLGRGGQTDVLQKLVAERAAELGYPSPATYVAEITSPDHRDVARLVEAVTVTHSWFFRDIAQLRVIEAALERRRSDRRVDVWVAGCAGGEDAYTIAMLARRRGVDAHVTGSDISATAIARAVRGEYRSWSVREVPEEHRIDFAWRTEEPIATVTPAIARNTSFTRHNLVAPPLAAPFGWDIVFCRNVLIYFYEQHAERALASIAQSLAPGGWLVLGSSELVHAPPEGLELIEIDGRFALRRPTFSEIVRHAPSIKPSLRPREPVSAPPDLASALATAHGQLRAGAVDLAVETYRHVLERSPHNASARLYLAVALYMSKDWHRAAETLRALGPTFESNWLARFYLGLCYEKLGRDDAARAELEHAAALVRTGAELTAIEPSAELDEWKAALVAVATSRARRSLRSNSRRQRPMTARAKILVVDDSEIVLDVMRMLLEDHGFDVATLSDAAVFDDVLEHEQPDLVLVDVGLEGASGDQLVARASVARAPRCPLVFLSDRDEEELEALVQRSGANGYIKKTDSGDVLAAAVSTFLDRPAFG